MSLAQLEQEKQQYQEQVDIVAASLNDDPENAELLGLKAELDEMLKMINESIADLAPAQSSKPAPPAPAAAPSPPPQPEKWSRANHPAFKKQAQEERERERAEAAAAAAAAAAADAAAVPIHYAVNDTVVARWVTGDKAWYPARITAVTGSASQPIYTVKFKSYDTVETLRAKDIKPANNKRKAGDGLDTQGASSTTAAAADNNNGSAAAANNNGIVLQSAPSVYPQAEKDETEKPVKKFKKIKATKELEKGKSKWQEFNSKGKFGKAAKKDSMFRTPEGVNGRVGFTGSGQAMRKDPTRSRHIYQPNEDVD